MYRQANYTFPEASVPRQELEDEKLVEHALMASRDEMKELVSDDESSSYDSWKERTVYTDDSLPYEGMVRSSSEEEKSAIIQDEPEQLYTLEYTEDQETESSDEFDSITSLDPWPLAHRLNDFDLEDRIVQDFGWDPEHRFSHMKYLKGLLKINNEDVREQHDNDPSSISDEGIRAKYFIDMMITGIDYRTHNLFSEMISKEQRKVIKGKFPSLIAMQETEELS